MVRRELMVTGGKERALAKARRFTGRARCLAMAGAMAAASAFPALAAEGDFDVTTTLASSFQGMATTILATIAATLPVVMSVMSAYICINFGIRFFRKFVK